MRSFFTILLLMFGLGASASHITGGEIKYTFQSKGTGTKFYKITMLLYRDINCFNCAEMPGSVALGIYNNDTRQRITGIGYTIVPLRDMERATVNQMPSCITNPPVLQYDIGYYDVIVELEDNVKGYTVGYQTCCRIDGISNTGNKVGATFTTQIPGDELIGKDGKDNSSQFNTGVSVMCYNNRFSLDFSAKDPDAGDVIKYELCEAYDGGAAQDASFSTPANGPYSAIPYRGGFSGFQPIGANAVIDPNTGIVSGIAPGAGKYIVNVCATSYRNGKAINVQRKDFIVTVAPCDLAGAELELNYISCDGFTVSRFENLNPSPLNKDFFWEFGDGTTSTEEFPSHTYKDTGTYTLKLTVNQGTACSDQATSLVKVYPGFEVDFTTNGPVCISSPMTFTDQSTTRYGNINYVKWDFGNTNTLADTSRSRTASYTYPGLGNYNVSLIATSSKGCIDTVVKQVSVLDKQPFSLPNDTLICASDTIQLNSVTSGSGKVTWSPNYMIDNINSTNPKVSPDVTTVYKAVYSDASGCTGSDSVKIIVTNGVSLQMPADTSICMADIASLRPVSNALYYEWSPSEGIADPKLKSINVAPTAPTTYLLRASISKNCFSTGRVNVNPVNYPQITITPDTTICVNSSVQLQATGGVNYSWRPAAGLSNAAISNPVASPQMSTLYTVAVTDNKGCPKPVMGEVMVNVVNVVADAGPRDTSVVLGQVLQLQGTGGVRYNWSPATYLDNNSIANPVANAGDNIRYVLTVEEAGGCTDTDTIDVKVYKMSADLLVPTAFSPGGDGLNDVLTPIPVGLKQLVYFRVYNRFGQTVFQTSEFNKGWSGKLSGLPQPSGNYVWEAEFVNYLDQKLRRKGNLILIR